MIIICGQKPDAPTLRESDKEENDTEINLKPIKVSYFIYPLVHLLVRLEISESL